MWKPDGWIHFKEASENRFILGFNRELDKGKILMGLHGKRRCSKMNVAKQMIDEEHSQYGPWLRANLVSSMASKQGRVVDYRQILTHQSSDKPTSARIFNSIEKTIQIFRYKHWNVWRKS